MAAAAYSAITGKVLDGTIALTGEIGIYGEILPVGGVAEKVKAAISAGAQKVLIPKDNYESTFDSVPQVQCIEMLSDALKLMTINPIEKDFTVAAAHTLPTEMLTAKQQDRS
ncbi:MAG: hypothetical protein IKB58_01305 [Oscillospiraceae bacterium]|nr:hypothetical protein [Oscillospiraceae bacterium]